MKEARAASAIALVLQASPWVPLRVRRGSTAKVSVRVPCDDGNGDHEDDRGSDGPLECLVWQVALEEFDVGFQVLCNGVAERDTMRLRAEEVAPLGEARPTGALASSATASKVAFKPFEGKLVGLKTGDAVTLQWDNTYSLVRHKQVRYRLLVTSRRVIEAAEVAAEELQLRAESSKCMPYYVTDLVEMDAMDPSARMEAHKGMVDRLEQCVMDLVAIFMTNPNCPLHEGAARALILALEAVLLDGIKEEFVGNWPEAPYYKFLLELPTVLRDDAGVVASVKGLEPPENLQCIGWNRARALLSVSLNKDVFHRAFENLTKRRRLIETYYKPTALLFDYPTAAKIASFLSALNAVKFLLAPFPSADDEAALEFVDHFPLNLQQCSPDNQFETKDVSFLNGARGDAVVERGIETSPDDISQLENCSVARYLLCSKPLEEYTVGRGSTEALPSVSVQSDIEFILVAQLKVYAQDIILIVGDADRGVDLIEPLRIPASDMWVEVVLRVSLPVGRSCRIQVKMDNSYSMVRAKQVQLRHRFVSKREYDQAWKGCLEMAQSISWKYASQAGQRRCDRYMASQAQQDEDAVSLQREKSASDADGAGEEGEVSIIGFRNSLIGKPVSRLVENLLSSDTSACEQCFAPFSFFSRQHVCPLCQKTVCAPCSRHYVQVNGRGPQLKVCDRCFVKEKDKKRTRLGNAQGGHGPNKESPAFAALRKDPTMEKYFKMLAFGVPPSAVVQKMAQEQVPPEKLAIFTAGPDGGRDRSGDQGDSHVPTRKSRSRAQFQRRDSTFRKVHWTSLESKKADDTIWARVTSRRRTAPIKLSPQDFQELEDLFGVSQTTSVKPADGSAAAKKKHKIHSALDPRRSNNISIGLSQFKSVGGVSAILRAVSECDLHFLTPERLETLQDIAPTTIETKRYSDFRGSRTRLEPAELFLVQMCEIPRVTEKIGAILFASNFEHQRQELTARITTIAQACFQVRQSERLARCFELVLAIGNLLNAGSELEDSRGVTLPSLLKLSETKSIDRSMTLLQFIIKLIHDRGESDILLFVNDLSVLADAKRFSNTMCATQLRALQHGIGTVEGEIKEDMISDLWRFEKEEAQRKRAFEQQQQRQLQTPPRMLVATAETTDSERGNSSSSGGGTAHQALLAAIRQRNNGEHQQEQTQQPDKMTAGRVEDDSSPDKTIQAVDVQPVPHSALLAAIRQRGPKEDGTGTPTTTSAISSTSDTQAVTDVGSQRSALLASIQKRQPPGGPTRHSASPKVGRAAMLAAIAQRGSSHSSSPLPGLSPADHPASTPVQYVPREYKLRSKFTEVMREALLQMKASAEDVETEMETLQSVWEETARYLGEDPEGSSSEYVLSLLNRFLLDVKVAKSLLFRKGLRFAGDLTASRLFPDAQIGSKVLTVFGGGVVTAMRASEGRLEVSFGWSRETYLSPDAVLLSGALVRCRRLGVGIIRSTRYTDGLCCVRFAFGVAFVCVDDLTPETASNGSQLRKDLLRSPACVGDPVVTPFGCGHVRWIRHQPRQQLRGDTSSWEESTVLAVELLLLSDTGGGQGRDQPAGTMQPTLNRTESTSRGGSGQTGGIAYVPASRVQLNY